MRREWLVVCAIAMLASCSLQDRLVHCGDQLCPFGSICAPSGGCTMPIDARLFDAPIDGPFACPAISATPPRFSTLWHQDVLGQGCHDYNFSATGVAVAPCTDVKDHIEQGPVDQPMTPIPSFEAVSPSPFGYPRITVEGDALFVLETMASVQPKLDRYAYSPSGWTFTNSIALPATAIGAPSAQPNRRMFFVDANFAHEVTLGDTMLTPVFVYTAQDLGVQTLNGAPSLSPDGLRIVFAGVDLSGRVHMYYADRMTLDGRFGPPLPIPGGPIDTVDPFLTPDCARLYFSAAGSVFYAQQQ
jgi:hypothetical protein